MPDGRSLMEEIGRDLESVEREIRSHPYLAELRVREGAGHRLVRLAEHDYP